MDALVDSFGSCPAQNSTGVILQLLGVLFNSLSESYCGLDTNWPDDYAYEFGRDGMKFDFIVIGAGTAGSTIAARLSENPNWNILVLEAGDNPPIDSEIPKLFLDLLNTTSDYNYFVEKSTKASLATDGHRMPRGRMLGGTSEMSALSYVRGNRHDYNQWYHMGNPTWEWDNVLKYFLKSEQNRVNSMADNSMHNTTGPLPIDFYTFTDPITHIISKAAQERGFPENIKINDETQFGFTELLATVNKGRRASASRAFLVPNRNRPNLKIIKNAFVTKLDLDIFHNIHTVNFIIKGREWAKVRAKREIIVSAGVFNTPKLLMLSGIGPAEHLRQLNIPIVSNLCVGNNLQDHYFIPYVVALENINQTAEQLHNNFNYFTNQSGRLSSTGTLSYAGYINTKGYQNPNVLYSVFSVNANDSQLTFMLRYIGYREEVIAPIVEANKKAAVIVFGVALLHPKSRGFIRLRSKNPFDKPRIYPNYLDNDEDLKTLYDGIRILQTLLTTDSFKEVNAKELHFNLNDCKHLVINSLKYWHCHIRQMTVGIDPVGSMKMGPAYDKTAVVDHQLRLRAVKNIRVVDASIMPTITSGSTIASTIMIAEKAADIIKQAWN